MVRKSRKRRCLRIIRDKDYGFSEDSTIGINIERIWRESKDEDIFIDEFAGTHTHELLHIVLEDIKLPDAVEEEVIRAMLNEEWNPQIEAQY
ncbi:hypothetical protein JW707_03370 [Candidatus Woesearchaeota archaeon]|nr:hypothetical protein [Candidatus Woesearchaeota archaeon]